VAIAQQVAEYASSFTAGDVQDSELHQTKRLLLDTLACAYGGLRSTTIGALRGASGAFGDHAECTIIGQPGRHSVLNGLLQNGAMVRFLDMNDVQRSPLAPGPRHGHNSEFFPLVLALGEKKGLSGSDVLVGAWTAYEISTRFTEAVTGDSLEHRGWNLDLRAAFVAPVVAGRMLGLAPATIQDAVGIALSRGMLLEVIDSSGEVNSMAKNLRVPLGIFNGVVATYLASAGVTGPSRALEGHDGFVETVLSGDFDLDHLTDRAPQGAVMRTVMKRFAACFATHGHLSATLELVTEQNLHLEDIEGVDIRTTTRGAGHTGDPGRTHPDNKETADHSSYYVTAALIRDRELGPDQYSDELYADPEIRRVASAVTMAAAPEYDDRYPAAAVTLRLRDGRSLERFVATPPGHPDNPLTDSDIEHKFKALSEGHLDDERAEAVIAATWRLEEFEDVRDYMNLLA
jgi:2-methylcitrate dehydratase